MGLGGALVMPSTLSITITVFDDAERPKAMAAWTSVAMVAMVGLVGSPVLGGFLIGHFSWYAIFFINVPVVVLAIAAALALMPESRGPWRKPDPFGAILSAAGMTALVWWIIGIPGHGAFGGRSAISLAAAIATLGGFVIWEHVTPEPMVPLNLFRHRNFSGGSLSLALLQIGNGGLLLVLTQYLQFVLGYSPVKAGLAFVPLAVAAIIGNVAGAQLSVKIGARAPVLAGMLVMATSFGLLTTVSATTAFAVRRSRSASRSSARCWPAATPGTCRRDQHRARRPRARRLPGRAPGRGQGGLYRVDRGRPAGRRGLRAAAPPGHPRARRQVRRDRARGRRPRPGQDRQRPVRGHPGQQRPDPPPGSGRWRRARTATGWRATSPRAGATAPGW